MKVTTLLAVAVASSAAYPLYKQCNPKWKSNPLGSGNKTVCAIGCAMSSAAMILADCGVQINGELVNPGNLNAWLRRNGGYSGNLLNWGVFSKLGLRYIGKIYKDADIKQSFRQGNSQIIQVRKKSHWVLMTGINSAGAYLVNDPGYSVNSYAAVGVSQSAAYRRPKNCKTNHGGMQIEQFIAEAEAEFAEEDFPEVFFESEEDNYESEFAGDADAERM